MNCLECAKPLTGAQRKFCCRDHKNKYNHKVLYNYKYQKKNRGSSPRNYLSQLRSYYNRRETLSLDFLVNLFEQQKGKCALSGVEMTHGQSGGRSPTNISIDRIDNTKGYTEDNVQLVCHVVNLMKTEYSKDALLFWCKRIIEHNATD